MQGVLGGVQLAGAAAERKKVLKRRTAKHPQA